MCLIRCQSEYVRWSWHKAVCPAWETERFWVALKQSHCILNLIHLRRVSTVLDLFIYDNMYTGIVLYEEKLFVSKQCNIHTGHYFVQVDSFLSVNWTPYEPVGEIMGNRHVIDRLLIGYSALVRYCKQWECNRVVPIRLARMHTQSSF
jgi:hypothetical protein